VDPAFAGGLFALAAVGVLVWIPPDWKKAAGGLLILVTVALMTLQLLGVL
jgi:hypothetical protein